MAAQARCPYCEWEGTSQGLKSHIRMGHAEHYARWGFDQVNSPSTGKIKREYLQPDTVQKTAWYGRYSRSQEGDNAKNIALLDANREPYPNAEYPKELREVEPATIAEKKFACGNCENTFDDPIWEGGEAYCPICEEMLNKDEFQ